MRGVNDDEAADLLRWCLERGYELRFIEQMPLDAQHAWSRDEMVTADEILAALSSRSHADARPGTAAARRPRPGSSTAAPAEVGIIASVTRPFCGDCDRARLTADGQIRNCLFAREESDLRTALRGARRRTIAASGGALLRAQGTGLRRGSSSRPGRCRPSGLTPAPGVTPVPRRRPLG